MHGKVLYLWYDTVLKKASFFGNTHPWCCDRYQHFREWFLQFPLDGNDCDQKAYIFLRKREIAGTHYSLPLTTNSLDRGSLLCPHHLEMPHCGDIILNTSQTASLVLMQNSPDGQKHQCVPCAVSGNIPSIAT